MPPYVRLAGWVAHEKPIETPDGSIVEFTSQYPMKEETELIHLNGLAQSTPDDYSRSTTDKTKFTFVSAPAFGDKILESYIKENGD